MLTKVDIVARFLPSREFRLPRKTSAPRTADCRRMGCGQLLQVLCGVVITVMMSTASIASPAPLSEHEVRVDDTASRARFARRVPAVGCDHEAVSEGRLVVKLSGNLCHGCVHNRFGKSCSSHSLHAQVLNSDEAEVSDYLCGQFVRHVLPNVGNVFVKSSELRFGLAPVFSAFGAAGQFFVEHSQSLFVPPETTWCWHSFSVGKDGEVNNSEVYSYRSLGFTAMRVGPFGFINLDLDRNVPVIGALDKADRCDSARESDFLAGTHPAKFGDSDSAIFEDGSAVINREGFSGTSLLFELWVTGFFASFDAPEEFAEGVSEIEKGSVRNHPRQLCDPREFNLFDDVELPVEFQSRGFFVSLVLAFPLSESPVVHEAGGTSTTFKPCSLNVVEVESNLVGEDRHDGFCSMSNWMALRTNSPSEHPRRLASKRNQARSDGSITISKRCFLLMRQILPYGSGSVKIQFCGFPINGYQQHEQTNEHVVHLKE